MKKLIRKEKKRSEKERLVSAGYSFCCRQCTDGISYIVRGGKSFYDNSHFNSTDDMPTPTHSISGGKSFSTIFRSRLSLVALNRNNSQLTMPNTRCSSDLDLKYRSRRNNIPTTIKNMTVSLSSIESLDDDVNENFDALRHNNKANSEKNISKLFMCRAPSFRRFSLKRSSSVNKTHYIFAKSPKRVLPFPKLGNRSQSVPSEIFRTWTLRRNKRHISTSSACVVQSNLNIPDVALNCNNNNNKNENECLKGRRQRRNAVCEMDSDERIGLKLYLRAYAKEKLGDFSR